MTSCEPVVRPPEGMSIHPLAPNCGVVVDDVDLQSLSQEEANDLARVISTHAVAFFENQTLSPESQQRVASLFGRLVKEPFVEPLPDYPYVTKLVKEAEESEPNLFGGVWHTDLPFLQQPPGFTMLHCIDAPSVGGDTLFANTASAFRSLSAPMKRIVGSLSGISTASSYTVSASRSHFQKIQHMEMRLLPDDAEVPRYAHPLVSTHPVTGQKALYFCPASTKQIEGMTRKESIALLDLLKVHATDSLFGCRFRWTKGAVAIWDNRVAFHRVLPDFLGTRREMNRSIVQARG